MMEDTDLRRALQWLNLAVVVLVVLVLGGVIFMNIYAAKAISDISRRQIEAVAHQNDLQLCAQHDITIAVRKIGRSLGLPTEDILVPNVGGIACP